MRSSISMWLDNGFNMYAVMALSAAVGLGGYEWICWSGLTASDWGTWVAAIGTVATFAVTIWLATAEWRMRQRDELIRAQVHAAAITFQLIRAVDVIDEFRTDLNPYVDAFLEWPEGTDPMVEVLDRIEPWTLDQIIAMVPLPDGVAAKLAAASGQLEQAHYNLVKAPRDATLPGTDKGTEFAENLDALLVRARTNLAEAIRGCNNARRELDLK